MKAGLRRAIGFLREREEEVSDLAALVSRAHLLNTHAQMIQS